MMRTRGWLHARGLGTALLAAGALACGPGGDTAKPAPPPAAPPPPALAAVPAPSGGGDAARQAELVFSMRCATCHGPNGAGDGPGSVALDPKPRDFRNAAWQASVSDDHLRKIIVEGGGAVGKSPIMPPNPDLAAQPAVVSALVLRVRGLRGK